MSYESFQFPLNQSSDWISSISQSLSYDIPILLTPLQSTPPDNIKSCWILKFVVANSSSFCILAPRELRRNERISYKKPFQRITMWLANQTLVFTIRLTRFQFPFYTYKQVVKWFLLHMSEAGTISITLVMSSAGGSNTKTHTVPFSLSHRSWSWLPITNLPKAMCRWKIKNPFLLQV